jgi:two-component system LytT family sensor kinase
MNTKKHVAIHLLCWVLLLIYFFIGALVNKVVDPYQPLSFSLFFIRIIEFYICYLWVFPSFLKQKKVPQLIGAIAVAMGAFISLRYLVEEILFPIFLNIHNYFEGTTAWTYIKDNIYWGTPYIVLAAAVWSIQDAFRSEKANKQLREEVLKAELSFLKSQINPHFLYNTLNYIYSLAIPISDQLSAAVLRLSDLMRYTLSEHPDGKVSLIKEVEYLESYIELFKMRFDPNFYVSFEVRGVTEQQRVASLLLLPFVENAFKHGVVNQKEHPVHILLEVKGKTLCFEVSNTVNTSQKDQSSGIGLINIYRRLNLIYPNLHQLDIAKNGNIYKTTLTINL